jgi:hypothetical protein
MRKAAKLTKEVSVGMREMVSQSVRLAGWPAGRLAGWLGVVKGQIFVKSVENLVILRICQDCECKEILSLSGDCI